MPWLAGTIVTTVALLACAGPAHAAFELSGKKQIALETRDGERIPIGTVTFAPAGEKTGFTIELETTRFKDFFLSMREFKCIEGKEIQCHVPYPYANLGTVTEDDLAWLETGLIFMFKTNAEFGATLTNGLYYPLEKTETGLAGTPYLVDLNQIAAPPDDPSSPPFPAAERLETEGGERWIGRLIIE